MQSVPSNVKDPTSNRSLTDRARSLDNAVYRLHCCCCIEQIAMLIIASRICGQDPIAIIMRPFSYIKAAIDSYSSLMRNAYA